MRAQSRELAAAHAEAARAGDAAGLGELCAALRGAQRAGEVIPEAKAEAVSIRRQIEEGRGDCAEKAFDFAEERVEAACALAAAGTPLARPALARAAARDPDQRVRAAAQGAVALDLAR